MLSLIVCSVNSALLDSLKKNVADTIGTEYEWLDYDNRKENKGICEVYNKMASKATYPYLVFLHEDLIFKTKNWGKCLVDVFEDHKHAGLIGIAGSDYKSNLLSGWYSGGAGNDYLNIIHRLGGKEQHLFFPDLWKKDEAEVVCIDGVFMACPRMVWSQVRFNEELLNGFHFYDIDFSLRVAFVHTVLVTKRIEIIHVTKGGDFGDAWIQQAFIYHQAAKKNLPYSREMNSKRNETLLIRYWLDWLKNQPVSFSNRIKWITKQKLYLKPGLVYSMAKFLVYRPLRLKYIHKFFKK
jgi:glycosyltransferase involved in cell wall biosynthesis